MPGYMNRAISLYENEMYRRDLREIAEQLPDRKLSVLITGATGLIGSHMIDVFLYAAEELHRRDMIYAMGRSLPKLKKRFPYALRKDGFYLIEQDACEPLDEKLQIDYIVNAASNADPNSYALYPAETILTNVIGTKNMLEYARNHKNTKVLLTSTMEVYGNVREKELYDEEDFGEIDFNRIRSGYPESKRTAELLCRSYWEEYAVPAVIARLGYIYGPTMTETDNKAAAQFLRKAMNRENIVLKSEGEQVRSYCYVSDAVSGIFKLLFEGKTADAYNVAASESVISIRGLAELAAELGNSRVVSVRPDELEAKGFSKPQNVVLDDAKLRGLGWRPRYGPKDGMRHTLDILRACRKSPDADYFD